jgi:hypothetical protein
MASLGRCESVRDRAAKQLDDLAGYWPGFARITEFNRF